MDKVAEDVQPIRDHSAVSVLFFVAFILIGTYFALNLFVAAVGKNSSTFFNSAYTLATGHEHTCAHFHFELTSSCLRFFSSVTFFIVSEFTKQAKKLEGLLFLTESQERYVVMCMCMCMCMCVCVCVYVYVYVYLHVCVCMYVCMYVCVYVCMIIIYWLHLKR